MSHSHPHEVSRLYRHDQNKTLKVGKKVVGLEPCILRNAAKDTLVSFSFPTSFQAGKKIAIQNYTPKHKTSVFSHTTGKDIITKQNKTKIKNKCITHHFLKIQ